MKMVEMKLMDGHTVYINPDSIVYIEDKSTFSETTSLIDTADSMLYVPYRASKVYEMIKEETEPSYCSWDTMRRLIEDEQKYKKQLAHAGGTAD